MDVLFLKNFIMEGESISDVCGNSFVVCSNNDNKGWKKYLFLLKFIF